MSKPGAKVAAQNAAHKHALGEAANSTSNSWFAQRRGKIIAAEIGERRLIGELNSFDLYHVMMTVKVGSEHRSMLIGKGPGVVFSDWG